MRTFFSKIGGFFQWLWEQIKTGSAWAVTAALVIAIAIVGSILIFRSDDGDTETQDGEPKVVQVFEPSIGTPLPPDTPGEIDQEDSQESTPEKPELTEEDLAAIENKEVTTTETTFVAPATGPNPAAPVDFQNDWLSVNMPAYTKVVETNNSVSFFDKTGRLLLTADLAPKQELTLIEQQLKLSPSVTDVKQAVYKTLPALSYTNSGLASISVNKNGHSYYLTGQKEYLDKISL